MRFLLGTMGLAMGIALFTGHAAESGTVYLSHADIRQERLDRYIADTHEYTEESKIQYLLSAMRESGSTFIRNGKKYKGKKGAAWLDWKRTHKQYANDPILTAWDFVKRVAKGSVRSGKPYEILFENGLQTDIQPVLAAELTELEIHIQQLNSESADQTAAEFVIIPPPDLSPAGE